MLRSLVVGLAVLATLVACAPFSYVRNPFALFKRDSVEEYDPYDFSSLKNIAAIGDSYSAGIGSGTRLGKLATVWPSELNAWSCK